MDLPRNSRVLIVDDDPSIRFLLVACLRRRGYQMLEACNGREALAEMRAGNADLVVMDLVMPEVSGWDVLLERAADPLLQQIPVIVVSASNTRQMDASVLNKGVSAVITKPFDLNALLTTVTTCLEKTHAPTIAAA